MSGEAFQADWESGSRLPAHGSANGRVLLSAHADSEIEKFFGSAPLRLLTPHTKTGLRDVLKEIRRVRKQGYATNDQEVELGVRTIAVPIQGRSGEIIGSLSMSAPSGDSDIKELVKLLPELQAARNRIERTL